MDRALSLSYYTVPELSFTETIDVAAASGCSHVGVRLLDGAPTDPPSPLVGSAALRREAMARMRDRGVQALDASAARLRPDTQVRAFEPMLDACVDLRIRHVTCSIDDPDVQHRADALGLLCELARARGVRVEIEFVPWMTIARLSDAAALIHETAAENLGILVDALHLDRSGDVPDDIRRWPADWFRIAQICDAPPCTDHGKADQIRVATQARCMPGEGALPLTQLVHALPRDIPLSLEIPMIDLARRMSAPARVKAAVVATRALLASADAVIASAEQAR